MKKNYMIFEELKLFEKLNVELQEFQCWLKNIKVLRNKVDNMLRNRIEGHILDGAQDVTDICQRAIVHYDNVRREYAEDPSLVWSENPLTYEEFYKNWVDLPEMDEVTEEFEDWFYSTKSDAIFKDYEESCMEQCLTAIKLKHLVSDVNYLLLSSNDYFTGNKEAMKKILDDYHLNTKFEERNSSIISMKNISNKSWMTYIGMKKLVVIMEKLLTKRSHVSFKFQKKNYVEALKLVQRWPSGSSISQQTIRIAILKSMVFALGQNAFS